MQAAPVHRWGLGFIAMRWRHLFWLLPLTGLLIGLGPLLWTLYGPTATGVIQLRFPHVSVAETERALVSDDVISRTVDSLHLTQRWGVDADTGNSKLRRIIHREPIWGTSLLEVHISGKCRLESIEIWNALIDETKLHFRRMRETEREEWEAPRQARLDLLKGEIDQLTGSIASDNRDPGDPTGQNVSQRIKDLERERISTWNDLLSGPYYCEDPIISHEIPLPSPSLFDRYTLQSLSAGGSISFGIGAISAVTLAYLLELLFPRRAESKAEN